MLPVGPVNLENSPRISTFKKIKNVIKRILSYIKKNFLKLFGWTNTSKIKKLNCHAKRLYDPQVNAEVAPVEKKNPVIPPETLKEASNQCKNIVRNIVQLKQPSISKAITNIENETVINVISGALTRESREKIIQKYLDRENNCITAEALQDYKRLISKISRDQFDELKAELEKYNIPVKQIDVGAFVELLQTDEIIDPTSIALVFKNSALIPVVIEQALQFVFTQKVNHFLGTLTETFSQSEGVLTESMEQVSTQLVDILLNRIATLFKASTQENEEESTPYQRTFDSFVESISKHVEHVKNYTENIEKEKGNIQILFEVAKGNLNSDSESAITAAENTPWLNYETILNLIDEFGEEEAKLECELHIYNDTTGLINDQTRSLIEARSENREHAQKNHIFQNIAAELMPALFPASIEPNQPDPLIALWRQVTIPEPLQELFEDLSVVINEADQKKLITALQALFPKNPLFKMIDLSNIKEGVNTVPSIFREFVTKGLGVALSQMFDTITNPEFLKQNLAKQLPSIRDQLNFQFTQTALQAEFKTVIPFLFAYIKETNLMEKERTLQNLSNFLYEKVSGMCNLYKKDIEEQFHLSSESFFNLMKPLILFQLKQVSNVDELNAILESIPSKYQEFALPFLDEDYREHLESLNKIDNEQLKMERLREWSNLIYQEQFKVNNFTNYIRPLLDQIMETMISEIDIDKLTIEQATLYFNRFFVKNAAEKVDPQFDTLVYDLLAIGDYKLRALKVPISYLGIIRGNISRSLNEFRHSPSKFLNILVDSLAQNFGTRKKVNNLLFKQGVNLTDEDASERIDTEISKIARALHDQITYNTGYVTKKAITVALGSNETFLASLTKKIATRVLGISITEEKDRVFEYINKDLKFHLFDVIISSLKNAAAAELRQRQIVPVE